MRKPNSIQVQDFLLVITSQSTLFTLEAEHEPTGRVFTINLDGDSIGQVTNGFFDSADKIVQGLKEAAENNSESIKLDMNLEGKLIYTAVFTSGVVKKEFGFTLNLTEKEMEPIQILNRKLDSAKKDMEERTEAQESKIQTFESQMEEKFDKLENIRRQMDQRLDRLENLYDNLKESVVLKPNIYFNHNSLNVAKFLLTDNNKTASLQEPERYLCLELLPQIPSHGQYSYSLKIKNLTRAMGFGIITNTTNIDWADNQSWYGFCTLNGKIYGRVPKEGNGKGPFGEKDDIIKMVVDMNQETLTFFVNGKQVNFCNISKSDSYFVFIEFTAVGDSVTLL
jgi:uncharacterized coiled-coil protein SlyX